MDNLEAEMHYYPGRIRLLATIGWSFFIFSTFAYSQEMAVFADSSIHSSRTVDLVHNDRKFPVQGQESASPMIIARGQIAVD